MTTLYQVPFEIDPDMIDMFEQLQEQTNVYFEASNDEDSVFVVGTMENLAGFFQELDGPAQSFPIEEFREWVSNFKTVDHNQPEEII